MTYHELLSRLRERANTVKIQRKSVQALKRKVSDEEEYTKLDKLDFALCVQQRQIGISIQRLISFRNTYGIGEGKVITPLSMSVLFQKVVETTSNIVDYRFRHYYKGWT